MASTSSEHQSVERTDPAALELACPQCGGAVQVPKAGQPAACPECKATVGKLAQLEQLLARWYEPRRWRADLVRPSVPYLLERLWTANGQGQRLYEGVSPQLVNYDVFRYMVTRLLMEGIEAGWADIQFPPDPLVEDPQYELRIVDSDRFARGVEKLFPEVDWDEQIQVPLPADAAPQPAASSGSRPARSRARRRR